MDGFAMSAPDPEQAALWTDWNSMVHMLVDRLPEELRQPLALSTLNDMNSHEIAGIMGLPDGTIRTRLVRARKLLRKKLASLEEGQHARSGR